MTLSDPAQITGRVADVFDRFKIPYLVGGSLASSLHGIPRTTQDVDIVADLKLQHLESFVRALETTFYVDIDVVQDAIQRRSSFNLIHLDTMFKVDIFVLQDDPASREEMARRQRYQVLEEPRQDLYLASAEDIILQKLHWYRLGGSVSERQWNDVLGVLQVQNEKIDVTYLRRRATEMEIEDLLEQAVRDAGIDFKGT